MIRLGLTIEYDGTDFSGWQSQPGQRTVQGEIEAVIERLCGRKIAVTGSGRTDAGVHAMGQYAHVDADDSEFDRVQKGLDRLLPDDVAIRMVENVDQDFHARFSALSRTYVYRISRYKRPLHGRYEHVLRRDSLDVPAMKQAAELCVGNHDWRAMSREGSDNSTWLVDVREASVTDDGSGWTFSITANRFLRGLVRIWSGTLVEIGLGNRLADVILQMFDTGDRKQAGPSLPAKGLTLLKVRYQ